MVSRLADIARAFVGHALRFLPYQPQTRLSQPGHRPTTKLVAPFNSVDRSTKNARLNAVAERNSALINIIHHQQERYPELNPAVITAIYTVELIGSYTARHIESGLTVDLTSRRNRSATKGPLSPLCRKLLDLGHDPEGKVNVIRKALDRDGHIPVFKRDRTLETWAGVDCVESETRSLHFQKYRPYPAAVETFHER